MRITADCNGLLHERCYLMDHIREYIFSVAVVSVLCSMILHLMHNFQVKKFGKIICGLVILVTLLGPIVNLKAIHINDFSSQFLDEAEAAVAMGQELSAKAQADIIKLKSEAYILDKAADLKAEISVCVSVTDDSIAIPFAAKIFGTVSPYARRQLEILIEKDLGISKENQQWIGN